MPKTVSDLALENAVEIMTGAAQGDSNEARDAYQAALMAEGLDEFRIIAALQKLDDLYDGDRGDASGEAPIWKCREGSVPTPRDDESQDEANARVCRILHLLNEPLPGTGTPLGDWVHAREWIHSIRSSDA